MTEDIMSDEEIEKEAEAVLKSMYHSPDGALTAISSAMKRARAAGVAQGRTVHYIDEEMRVLREACKDARRDCILTERDPDDAEVGVLHLEAAIATIDAMRRERDVFRVNCAPLPNLNSTAKKFADSTTVEGDDAQRYLGLIAGAKEEREADAMKRARDEALSTLANLALQLIDERDEARRLYDQLRDDLNAAPSHWPTGMPRTWEEEE